MSRRPLFECSEPRGERVPIPGGAITPVAKSLLTRWPGGRFEWSGPSAVLVEQDGETDRILIRNLNRQILWAMRLGALALITFLTLQARRREKNND